MHLLYFTIVFEIFLSIFFEFNALSNSGFLVIALAANSFVYEKLSYFECAIRNNYM